MRIENVAQVVTRDTRGGKEFLGLAPLTVVRVASDARVEEL